MLSVQMMYHQKVIKNAEAVHGLGDEDAHDCEAVLKRVENHRPCQGHWPARIWKTFPLDPALSSCFAS